VKSQDTIKKRPPDLAVNVRQQIREGILAEDEEKRCMKKILSSLSAIAY
jgi:hypothetical protein